MKEFIIYDICIIECVHYSTDDLTPVLYMPIQEYQVIRIIVLKF